MIALHADWKCDDEKPDPGFSATFDVKASRLPGFIAA